MVLGGNSCDSLGRRAQMLGVRFGAVCAIMAAGMLASSVADAAPGCDRRFSRTCRPVAAQTTREAPLATSGQRPATATRTRRVVRHRHALKHAQSTKPARRESEKAAAPAAALEHAP